MTIIDDVNAELAHYLNSIGEILGSNTRKESFAVYVAGLMSSLERKTVEGIAAMACTEPSRMEARHQELLHVIGQAHWEDAPVRAFAARHALMEMGAATKTTAWIVDDTGFPSRGGTRWACSASTVVPLVRWVTAKSVS